MAGAATQKPAASASIANSHLFMLTCSVCWMRRNATDATDVRAEYSRESSPPRLERHDARHAGDVEWMPRAAAGAVPHAPELDVPEPSPLEHLRDALCMERAEFS